MISVKEHLELRIGVRFLNKFCLREFLVQSENEHDLVLWFSSAGDFLVPPRLFNRGLFGAGSRYIQIGALEALALDLRVLEPKDMQRLGLEAGGLRIDSRG